MVYLLFTWNHIIVWKLFILKIVTWSYNGLLSIIIIIIIISYMKPYNCVEIICIKNSYLKL